MKASAERLRGATRAVVRPSEGLNLKYIAFGVIAAFFLAFILSGVVGLVMYEGWLSEGYSPVVMNTVCFASLFAGAIYTGRRAGTAGWAHGGLVGLCFIAVVTLVGLTIFDQLAPLLVLCERGGLAVVLGAVAGTVGINLRD